MGGFMLFWGFAILHAASAVEQHKIHKRMSSSEIMQIFKTTMESVPDYEITRIHWSRVHGSETTAGGRMYLKAFGKNIQLWLTPTDKVLVKRDTPIYSLKSGALGPVISKYTEVMEQVERYENLKKSAVLAISQRGNNSQAMVGTIGSENLVVNPIPERLLHEVKRKRRSADDFFGDEEDDHHYHIVYKGAAAPIDRKYLDSFLPKRNTLDLWSTSESPENVDLSECAAAHSRCLQSCGDPSMVDNWIGNEECAKCQENARSFIELCPLRPNTVVPRILVVVAHDIFEIFDKNHIDAIVYLVAFWNGVDLRYRYFENPKFRLNIAGIVLTEDSKALEYMTAHVIDETTVEVFDTQDGSRRYWYARGHDIPFDTYDVVVTMTSKQMCEFPPDEKEKGVCKGGILGIADVGGACARSDSSKELLNVAIIQDKTAFNGIHTAVHELAHLFGAKHDGIMRTQECSPDDGYIMSSGPRLNDKSAQWSNCTLKDIQHFLDNNPNCLNNNIEDGEVLPVYLPGKFLDADGQCYWVMKTKACNMSSSICRSLSCQHPFSGACTKIGHPAADGTTCESEKICLYGECIHESMIYS